MSPFKIDLRIRNDLAQVAADARAAEELGCHGAWNSETDSDPFLGLTLMAEHTDRISFGPAIAVAFARSPMTMAYTAYQLQQYSRGRLLLGLGSQVRAYIERRFGVPWSHPAARMHEYIRALQAIWTSWATGERLQFRGRFSAHTLMPPLFRPARSAYPAPKIYLAAVNELMVGVAGEVADGVLPHPFTTERYLREVVRPGVRAGQARAGRAEDSVELAVSVFIARDEKDFEAVRRQISFYGSTPAYRPVLELHGWGELQTELHALSVQNRWAEMVPLVPDEVVEAMCVSGSATDIARGIRHRFTGVADRTGFYVPGDVPSPHTLADLIDALRS